MLKLLLVHGLRRMFRDSQRITTARALFSSHEINCNETKRRHFVFSAVNKDTDFPSSKSSKFIDRLQFENIVISEQKLPTWSKPRFSNQTQQSFCDAYPKIIGIRFFSTDSAHCCFNKGNYQRNYFDADLDEKDSSYSVVNINTDKIYNM